MLLYILLNQPLTHDFYFQCIIYFLLNIHTSEDAVVIPPLTPFIFTNVTVSFGLSDSSLMFFFQFQIACVEFNTVNSPCPNTGSRYADHEGRGMYLY